MNSAGTITEEIIYDFRNYKFFEPIDILLFAMSVIYFKNFNIHQKYIHPLNFKTQSYLEKIGLKEFCLTNYSQPNTIKTIPLYSAMPLRRITTATMNEYIELAKEFFSRRFPDKDLDFLNITISELINNVYDHSNSPIDAYVFCQFYPTLNVIKVVVGDLGIGIPESVNNYLISNNKHQMNDKDAINWAIDENTSTKSHPYNRGKGFNNLIGFITYNRSIMSLYSNSAILMISKGRQSFFDNNITNFRGTAIQMDIYIDNLPQIDHLITDFWEQF
jgi:phage-related holin